MLGVLEDGPCKYFHFFLGFGTKLCVPNSINLFEFSSIDEDNVVVREAKVFYHKVGCDFSSCLHRLVCFIDSVNQPFVTNQIVFSLNNAFFGCNGAKNLKLGISTDSI